MNTFEAYSSSPLPDTEWQQREEAIDRFNESRAAARENNGEFISVSDLEACEPDCTCSRSDVDLYDAGDCEFHNPSSSWNRQMRLAQERETEWVELVEFTRKPIQKMQMELFGEEVA